MLTKLLKAWLGDDYSEQNARVVIRNLGLTLLMFIFAAIMLFFLPDRIPMQWKADGSVSYTLPSAIGVWVLPGISLLVNISWISKGNFEKSTTVLAVALLLGMGVLFGINLRA